jgi:hypothetical protein
MDRPRAAQAPWWHLALWWLASVAAALAHNGLWATPNLAFVSLIAGSPGENPFNETLAGDYLLSDVSLTSLARVLGQTDPHALARLHLLVLLVGWVAVTILARRRYGYETARALTVVIGASPLVTVSMQWLGQPDPLTGLCGVAMVLVRRRWTVLLVGVVAGLTHPEQAVFMAAIAGVVRFVLPAEDTGGGVDAARVDRDWALASALPRVAREVVTAVGGVAIGWTLTQAWFRVNDIVVLNPRSRYLDYGLDGFMEHHGRQPIGTLWTLWGPLWLLMGALAIWALLGRSNRPGSRDVDVHPPGDLPTRGAARAWTAMAVLAVVALAPVAVTLDETRVYAVITAPLLAGAAIWIAVRVTGRVATRSAVVLLAVTAILPGGFATGVTSWRPQLDTPAMVSFLVTGDVPDDAELTPWLISPFDFVIPELPA